MTLFATSDTTFLEKQQLHIRRKIGEGSFSKVYLSRFGAVAPTADDEAQATLIATKVINKNRVSAKFVEKFLPRELDVLLKLRHPFLVQVHSMYQRGYKIYINMEYAENGDLFTYLRRTTLSEPQIRSWFIQILRAFKYMHGVGVVHRDVKCENILLTGNYNVRVADFGFARFVGRGRNPGADTVCGTLAYSSPELLSGARPYNPVASDVWAVGVVLFMMANNVAPFRDKRKEDMLKKQLAKDYAFRKMLNRSEPLKELTAAFLEPDVVGRVRIRHALQCAWILEQRRTAETVEKNADVRDAPIITQTTLRAPEFHYRMTAAAAGPGGKSASVFNRAFDVQAEERELDDAFYL